MIRGDRITAALKDVNDDPRQIEETIRDLGVDPFAAVATFGHFAVGAVEAAGQVYGIADTEDATLRLAFLNAILSGFVVGLAVGREAAHDDASAL